MQIAKTESFTKAYAKLPKNIQKQVDKQLTFLSRNLFHPSLKTKRMGGMNFWEARVSKSYRMPFEKAGDIIMLRTVGPHDEGLGKK